MQYGWALIGYGGMACWHHKFVRDHIAQLCPIGAFDIRAEAAKKAEDNDLHVYQNLQELLDDTRVQIITIATPNDVHKEIAIRCLRAGKHVVCEKPVTMNAAELEEVIAVAEAENRVFTIHHNRRWDRDYRIARSLVGNGQIGKSYFIESRVQGSRGAMHGWRGYKQNGGGMLLDWGVHLVDQILMMVPEKLVSVNAHLINVFSDEVEDSIKLTLGFESGLSALLEMSTNCFINQPRWHICGTEGTAVIQNWDCEGEIVKLNTDAKMEWADDIVYTSAGPTRTMAPRPKHTSERLPLPQEKPDLSEFYKNVCATVSGAEELLVTPQQALRTMKTIDLLFESERVGHGFACNI